MSKWLEDVAEQIRGFAALPNWPEGIEAWPVDRWISITYRGRVHQIDPHIFVLHPQHFGEAVDKVFRRMGVEELDPPILRVPAIDKAYSRINALGGTVTADDQHGTGYVQAIDDALTILKNLGAKDAPYAALLAEAAR